MRSEKGFTLVELMIVVLILGALAAIAIPRILGGANTARINACQTNCQILNSQTELWNANEGDWPDDVAELTNDPNYFPEGLPVCPFETAYELGVNHRIIPHSHP
ncbi:hypothetical protein ES703_25399 [subsurface metagenome]